MKRDLQGFENLEGLHKKFTDICNMAVNALIQ